jgi:hypothetical protein
MMGKYPTKEEWSLGRTDSGDLFAKRVYKTVPEK